MSKILKVVGAFWLRTKISSYILGGLGLLSILALFFGQIERAQEDGNYAATVFFSQKTGYRIEYWGQSNKLAEIPKGVARAYFRRDTDTSGWSLLEVETDSSYSDETQAYAAGIVEGALTWYLIHTHLENTIRAKCDGTPLEKQCDKLKDTLDKSVNVWKTYAAEHAEEDPFWHHVSLHYTQINGIYTGWKHGVERSLNEYDTDVSDLYWLNYDSEVVEIQRALNITVDDAALDQLPGISSAFLRIVNETNADGETLKKLYVAHNAAGSYNSMTRILKRYKLNYHLSPEESSLAPIQSVEFSGYPGSVTSQDEFYVLGGETRKMAVTATAIRNYNEKLWTEVDIVDQVPLGPRVTAANHLATNVSSWGHVLATRNSGTACKQWLVVDLERFDHLHESGAREAKSKPARNEVVTEISVNNGIKHTVVHRGNPSGTNGLVWLIEQVPGLTHARDMSETLLQEGYLATYGLPLINDIIDTTHLKEVESSYGSVFSASESPRALAFKLGYKNATSVKSIVKLMRHNNVTAMNRARNETVGCGEEVECIIRDGGYWAGLGVRGDIVSAHREPYGVIDTKVVSVTQKNTSLEFVAISGPPYTDIKRNETVPVNKGNVASVYTDHFNGQATINGLEIRDLVKQQEEQAEQETLEMLEKLNRDVVKPFQWSESEFNDTHVELPDEWAFGPYNPKWSW